LIFARKVLVRIYVPHRESKLASERGQKKVGLTPSRAVEVIPMLLERQRDNLTTLLLVF